MCTVNHFEWSCHLVAEPPGARADHRVSFPVLSWSRQRDLTRRRGRVVQARACKALYMGSIPIVASEFSGPSRRPHRGGMPMSHRGHQHGPLRPARVTAMDLQRSWEFYGHRIASFILLNGPPSSGGRCVWAAMVVHSLCEQTSSSEAWGRSRTTRGRWACAGDDGGHKSPTARDLR